MHRYRPLVVVVIAVALLLAGAGNAQAHFGLAPADSAAKPKKKAKKCKKGRVRVKILKRRLCQSARKALPRPRPGDRRLLFTKRALGANLKGLRDRKGRRPRSIKKALRRISPRAASGMARGVTRGFKMLDRLALNRPGGTAGAARVGARAAASDTYTMNLGGGASVDIRVKLISQGSAELELTARQRGRAVRTTIGLNVDLGFRGPQCPTAQGTLAAKDGLRVRITTEVLDARGGVDSYYTQVVFQDTKLTGKVGDDAKLDELKVEDTLRLGEYAGGSILGDMRIESKITRETVVKMRTGAYDPGRSRVQVSVALGGILRIFQSSATAGATERLQKAANEGFAATVHRAMEKFRERESAWQTPPFKCADVRLTPASGSLTLRTGDSGQIRAETTSKQDGGKPPTASWITSGEQNASFGPPVASGNPASFNYGVGAVASGAKVRATFKATSRAGVAETEWVQNTRSFEINKIAGNFTGDHSRPVGDGTGSISWTGGGTFLRSPPGSPGAFGNYVLNAGSANFTYSGRYIGGDAACDMSGSAFVDLFQDAGGSIVVSPAGGSPFLEGPHDYGGSVDFSGPDAQVTVTLSNCADPNVNGETRTFPIAVSPLHMGPSQQSPDGIHYNGSHSESSSGITTDWSWLLTGAK